MQMSLTPGATLGRWGVHPMARKWQGAKNANRHPAVAFCTDASYVMFDYATTFASLSLDSVLAAIE